MKAYGRKNTAGLFFYNMVSSSNILQVNFEHCQECLVCHLWKTKPNNHMFSSTPLMLHASMDNYWKYFYIFNALNYIISTRSWERFSENTDITASQNHLWIEPFEYVTRYKLSAVAKRKQNVILTPTYPFFMILCVGRILLKCACCHIVHKTLNTCMTVN